MTNRQKRPLAESITTEDGKSVGDIVANFLWMLTVADPNNKQAFCAYFRANMPHINDKRRRVDLRRYGRNVDMDKIREVIDMVGNIDQYLTFNNIKGK